MDKSTIITKETQRAQDKMQYQDNFIAQNYWLWVVFAFVLYPLAAVFSALTEGGHVYLRTKESLGLGILPWAITILVVILVEAPKFFLGKGAVDDIQAGVFSDRGPRLALFIVKVLGFIAVMAFSINLSIQGAPVINQEFRKHYKPLAAEYINVDSINANYDDQVAIHRVNIANYEKTTWKGKIVGDARKMIMKEQGLIEGLEARRSEDLSRTQAENDQIRKDHEAKTAENGQWAMGFAGFGEVLCLFCLVLIGIYDNGIKGQAKTEGQTLPSPTPATSIPTNINMAQLMQLLQQGGQQNFTQIPPNQSTPTTPADESRRQIGFRQKGTAMKSPYPHSPEEAERDDLNAPLPWQQKNEKEAFNVVQRTLNVGSDGTKLVDARYFKSWMKTAYKRSLEYKTEESRHYQHCLYRRLRAELEEIGWTINENETTQELDIQEA